MSISLRSVQMLCAGCEYEVCMWSSVFTILVAVFDLCALMKHVTMFSEDRVGDKDNVGT